MRGFKTFSEEHQETVHCNKNPTLPLRSGGEYRARIGQRSGPNVRYYAAPAMKSADAVNAARVTPQMSAGTSDVSLYVTMQVKITP